MKKPKATLLLLMLLTLAIGSALARINASDTAACNEGSKLTVKVQKLSVTLMNIELIGFSVCEMESPVTRE